MELETAGDYRRAEWRPQGLRYVPSGLSRHRAYSSRLLGKSVAGSYAKGLSMAGMPHKFAIGRKKTAIADVERESGTLIKRRRTSLAVFFAVALLSRFALADAYDPPANYYNTATGTGTTLKQQLNDIIDNHTVLSYDSARSNLQVTDADPAQPGHIITVYDRTSLNVTGLNASGIPGWDPNVWNREHTWPRSRGVGSSGPDDSDMFELRPAITANNGDRGDLNFGGAFGAQPYGTVTDGGQTYWYPGNADAGMIARQEFYMAVRYDGADANTQDLEIGTGNVANPTGSEDAPPQLGNLTRMLEWHYAAVPDAFERRRNQIIYDQFQHNRDPFTDHPEYVWSVFVNQTNDSQITIAAPTTVNTTTGSSTKIVNLTNVIVGGTVPSAQTVTLNKAGNNGTYYSVTTGGLATSSVAGPFNAFRTNQTDSKSITVGLNTNTTSAGLRTGTVTVDNLDITAGSNGGVGHAANDANDVITVNLNVLDHAIPSFATPSQSLSQTIDFGNIALGASATPASFDIYNLNAPSGFTAALDLDSVASSGNTSAFTTDLASFSNLAAGASQSFTSSFNVTSVGSFLSTYTLTLSDENLSGATNKTMTLTLKGVVRLAGDFDGNGSVDSGDYLVWRRSFGQTGLTAYSGADGDGNTVVDDADYDVWRAHFGQTASGLASNLVASSIPEPATASPLAIAAVVVCHCLRRTK
jgi:endonuclease I